MTPILRLPRWLPLSAAIPLLAAAQPAGAAGCLKGGAVGALAGHAVGHGVAGAAVGCAVGHHQAKKAQRNQPTQTSGSADQGGEPASR